MPSSFTEVSALCWLTNLQISFQFQLNSPPTLDQFPLTLHRLDEGTYCYKLSSHTYLETFNTIVISKRHGIPGPSPFPDIMGTLYNRKWGSIECITVCTNRLRAWLGFPLAKTGKKVLPFLFCLHLYAGALLTQARNLGLFRDSSHI